MTVKWNRSLRAMTIWIGAVCAPIVLFGCGGGGGVAPATTPLPTPGANPPVNSTPPPVAGAAVFDVNLATGQVSVSQTTPGSRALFSGDVISFQAKLDVNSPDDPSVRVIDVTITNNWPLAIGVTPAGTNTGVKAILNNFTVTAGTPGPITVSNPSGFIPGPGLGATEPYFSYPSIPAAGSQTGQWGFIVAGGVTRFSFMAVIEGNTPVETPPQSAPGAVGSASTFVRTFAGPAGMAPAGFVNGQAPAARFNDPVAATCDGMGDVFVADNGNDAIREITPDGKVSIYLGAFPVQGGAANGPLAQAQFQNPAGLAFGPDGALYVADYGNNQIRRIALAAPGGTVSGAMGTTTVRSARSGVSPQTDSFRGQYHGTPAGPYRDMGSGMVPTASLVAGAPDGTAGDADGTGDKAQLNHPEGITVDPDGNIYVTEPGTNLIRLIQLFGSDPTMPASWQVTTLPGSGAPTRNIPRGIASDHAGTIYVTNSGAGQILKITPGATPVPLTLSGAATTLPGITGIAADPAGFLYVTAGTQVFRVDPAGTVEIVAGTPPLPAGGTMPEGVDGPGSSATFGMNPGIAIDPSGNLFVADGANNNIRLIERTISGI